MNRKPELTADQMEQLQELLGMEIDPEDEPAWTDGKTINETLFAEQFLKKYQLIYSERAFFSPDGRVSDPDLLRSRIFDVFTWEDGSQYDPNYITRTFSKLTKQFGRPEITLHKLRHTCVSLLSEMGWDLKKIQYWCGHRDFNTTANIYMHFNRQRLNDSADDLAVIAADCDDLFVREPLFRIVEKDSKMA